MIAVLQGDSLAVGIHPYVHVRRYSARVGRGTAEGVRLLATHRPRGEVVLISLGTNDYWRPARWFRHQVWHVKRMVGDGCTVWGTTPNSRKLNHVLWHARGPHFKVVRHVRPGPDGLHPTSQGYKRLAARYERAAGRC